MNTNERIMPLNDLLLRLSDNKKLIAEAFRRVYGHKMEIENFENFVKAQEHIAAAIVRIGIAMTEILISE